MHALESNAPLIVYVDIKSPYAFISLRPTMALEDKVGVPFDWRPLTLDIPSYLGSARKVQGKVVKANRSPSQWGMVRYAYMDARRYAEEQGFTLKGTEKIWNSELPHIGMLWVAERAPELMRIYLGTIFPPFWRRELDIENPEVVCQCLRTAGVPTDGFEDYSRGEGGQRHDALQAQLHPSGVYGVPTYVLDGEVLFGRENLSYISWYLAGRQGLPPDIANPVDVQNWPAL